MNRLAIVAIVIGLAVAGYFTLRPARQGLSILVPEFTRVEQQGENAFNDNCAACHGPNMVGTENGPPLLHRHYVPEHHPDRDLRRAVEQGVEQHHWTFGNMPAQDHIDTTTLDAIIAYIRALQFANGIC